MASFHFSAQVIGRSKGRSAIAAAAYRAGTRLQDEARGTVADFSHRRGVVHTEILAPEGSAAWLRDRGRLWNGVEQMERRWDAQLAREINLALPESLSEEQRRELVRSFVLEQFVSRGMVADLAIHAPVTERGDDPRNHHAHVMLTLRQATSEGLRPVKTREWNSEALLTAWREAWARHQNRSLARAGLAARVDHRSLKAQRADALAAGDRVAAARLDRAPEIHIGPRARAAARRGHTPTSREREARLPKQPRRQASRPGQGRAARVVAYPRIDQGSRLGWNAHLVLHNEARVARRAEHRERQAVRLRQAEARAVRTVQALEQRLAAWRPAGFGWNRAAREAEGLAQRQQWQQVRDRARRHARLARTLLQDVERILAGLLQVQSAHRGRHRSLMDLGISHTRPLGRGRARTFDQLFSA